MMMNVVRLGVVVDLVGGFFFIIIAIGWVGVDGTWGGGVLVVVVVVGITA